MSTISPATANLGFPRIGLHRELKFALESFWRKRIPEEELQRVAKELRRRHWLLQRDSGIGVIPSNDFSFYDQVLDVLVALGATPARFGSGAPTLERYFQMARNSEEQTAMEMTKWFDTNYHYLAPEWSADLAFAANPAKAVGEFLEARNLGLVTRPVLIGPITLLRLGKVVDGCNPLTLLPRMLTAYRAVLDALAAAGAEWVQMDEPLLVTDLRPEDAAAYRTAYAELAQRPLKIMLTTYFGALGDNLELACSLPVAGLHVDAVRGAAQLSDAVRSIGSEKILSIGCVDGRNIWTADLARAAKLVQPALDTLGAERVLLAPSCSLLHVPYDIAEETALNPAIRSWMSFAVQKLGELKTLSLGSARAPEVFAANRQMLERRAAAESSVNAQVRTTLAGLRDEDFARTEPYAQRAERQRAALHLPLLPTTTIGSFPQTADVRKQRAALKNGTIMQAEYDAFIRGQIVDCVRRQEALGLDVLVHGEFERNDMVEYFGEKLAGFTFTHNGWVQSYGSRCVKPPVIYGDVSRPAPMTVEWTHYACSLTRKPMKGMLTGPITILQWSFVRDDISEKHVAWQIALALREELRDLEAVGVRVIQVDEPALREGLPLRRGDWQTYLDWAVKAFRLATSGVDAATQIHTHMCYSEFEDILDAIAALDADVISIESARSRMELLEAFRQHGYPNEIGPGIYDIHSPRVPSVAEMRHLLELALAALKPAQLWVNPDCGLKTRGWPETTEALKNMCAAAAEVRASIGVKV